jgi:uncharacterized protein (TIGR02145 family)
MIREKNVIINSILALTGIAVFLSAISCGKMSLTGTDSSAETLSDIDGNIYTTVKIGNQTWILENLRTTKYNDASSIQLVTDKDVWNELTGPAYCYFGNTTNADSIRKFWALYNWHMVNTGKLAPLGWHEPDTVDWGHIGNVFNLERLQLGWNNNGK